MAKKQKAYLVVRGLSWYDDGRAEPGETRDDIPEKSIPWLLENGDIVDPDAPTEVATELEGEAN